MRRQISVRNFPVRNVKIPAPKSFLSEKTPSKINLVILWSYMRWPARIIFKLQIVVCPIMTTTRYFILFYEVELKNGFVF